MRSRIVGIPGIVIALAVLLVLPAPVGASASGAHSLTLFGPESFARTGSAPVFAVRTFQAPSDRGLATLHVVNGDDAGRKAVSTAVIKVNGAPVVRHWPLKKRRASRLDVPLRHLVQGKNTLSVRLYGAPGTRLTLSVTADYPLDIAIESPAAGSAVYSDRATVRGTYESYAPRVEIAVNGVAASVAGRSFTAVDVPLASGANALTATIRTPEGLSDSDTVRVSANLPPTAEAGGDRVVMTGTAVPLDGRDSFDPEGDLIRYRWEVLQYPDGGPSSAFSGTPLIDDPASVTPTFYPVMPGSYLIALVVNDGHSDSPPDSVRVTAEQPNVAPTANAGADQSVAWGSQVFLRGEGSDPDGNLLTYLWEFLSVPAGSAAALDDPSSPAPAFVADAAGSYVIGLTVSDGLASSLQDAVTVVSAAPNAPPVAHAGADQAVALGATIRLDGTGSTDPEDDPLFYGWTIVSMPQGSAGSLDGAASPTPTVPADAAGEFVFRLTVSDGGPLNDSDTVVVKVAALPANGPPVADAGPDAQTPPGVAYVLSGGGSSDPDGDPLTYRWSIVSAPYGTGAAISDPDAANPVFTPDFTGLYELRLIVNDGSLDSAADIVAINVVAQVAVWSFVGNWDYIATGRIQSNGLSVGNVTYVRSGAVAAGRVISQNPPAGDLVFEGSPVDLIVSDGP